MVCSVCMFCGPSDQSETHNSHPLNLFFLSFNRPVWQPQAQQLNWNRVVPLIRRDIRSNKQEKIKIKNSTQLSLAKTKATSKLSILYLGVLPFREAKGWTCRQDGPKVCSAASMANLCKWPHLFKMDSYGEGEVVLRAAGRWSQIRASFSAVSWFEMVVSQFRMHLSGSAVKQQMRMMNPSLIKAQMWKSLSVK